MKRQKRPLILFALIAMVGLFSPGCLTTGEMTDKLPLIEASTQLATTSAVAYAIAQEPDLAPAFSGIAEVISYAVDADQSPDRIGALIDDEIRDRISDVRMRSLASTAIQGGLRIYETFYRENARAEVPEARQRVILSIRDGIRSGINISSPGDATASAAIDTSVFRL